MTRLVEKKHPLFVTATLVTCASCFLSPLSLSGDDFGDYWYDGQAELSGYQFTVNRYGESRNGQAVMVYVTEPFSETKHVKVDNPDRAASDLVEVMKLNLVRDFQTGIYDYNTMISIFSRSDDFAPLKISFSSAEWCGHVYEELLFEPHRITDQFFSYFEDESTARIINRKRNGISEDNLFILLRSLRGPYLAPGERRSAPMLPSAFYRRLTHQPISWQMAKIERMADTETIDVPAGAFTCIIYRIETSDGREGIFCVEQEHPRRIVRWQWEQVHADQHKRQLGAADGGELTGTARMKYWELRGNDHERYLKELGIASNTSPGK